MFTFEYEVLDSKGKTLQGTQRADSEEDLIEELEKAQYIILQVRRVDKGIRLKDLWLRLARVHPQALAAFSREFATMINTGMAISRCLDVLARQTKDPVLQPALRSIRLDILGGCTFTDALENNPRCFNPFCINLIRTAEVAGTLDTTLDRLAEYLEKEYEIRQRVKSAMMYPITILVFSILVMTVMMVSVLPKFLEIFSQLGITLPLPTRLLFAMSDQVQHYGYLLLALPFVLASGIKKYGQTRRGRRYLDLLKLKTPIVGSLWLKMGLSRFARTLATLVNSGVPIMRSLEIVAETCGNVILGNAVDIARGFVREGLQISGPLEVSGWFPPAICQMISVGEETGYLSETLLKVAEYYDMEVDSSIRGLTALIEPIIIMGLGFLVGFIALALITPIFTIQHALTIGALGKH